MAARSRSPQPYRLKRYEGEDRLRTPYLTNPRAELGVWSDDWTVRMPLRARNPDVAFGSIHATHSLAQFKSVVFCRKCWHWEKMSERKALCLPCTASFSQYSPGCPLVGLTDAQMQRMSRLQRGLYPYPGGQFDTFDLRTTVGRDLALEVEP